MTIPVLDLRGERCPWLLSRIISALEDGPDQGTLVVLFSETRLAHRLGRHVALYGGRLLELAQLDRRTWRARLLKVGS